MKSKLKPIELSGFMVWVISSLIFTVILCQYLLPQDMKANNLLKELVEVRGFFKRVMTVFLICAIMLPIALGLYMWVIETDPSEFRNLQGRLA